MADSVTNPFFTEAAARRYAAARPDYGPFVTPIISRLTGLAAVPAALDVGSGTGISTHALLPIANLVVGVESSLPMLAQARPSPRISYLAGTAEALPFADGVFPLVAAGSAHHWFDLSRFAAEATRVATGDARLILHNHGFAATLDGTGAFGDWVRDEYVARYPAPPRHRAADAIESLGSWRRVASETYEHLVAYSVDELIDYLTTQSNLRSVVDGGRESEAEVRGWLHSELAPFLGGTTKGHFGFAGSVVSFSPA